MTEVRGSRAAVLRAYNFFRPFYGLWAALLERQAVARGLQRANVHLGERVLEVGVGTAAAFVDLRRQAGTQGYAIGVDISPRMLAATRHRVLHAVMVQADARALPFPTGYFDLVWSSYLLDLIPTGELVPLLLEFRRVLRPSGRMLLVNLSKKDEGMTWWERAYRLTPSRMVPYVFGGCRPIQAAPFVREAGFTETEREFVSEGLVRIRSGCGEKARLIFQLRPYQEQCCRNPTVSVTSDGHNKPASNKTLDGIEMTGGQEVEVPQLLFIGNWGTASRFVSWSALETYWSTIRSGSKAAAPDATLYG